jgi:hypothetical protein
MALTQITEKGIKDGEILNADINASAAIAGTKISPDFGSQNIVTTGSITGADLEIDSGTLSVDASDNRVGIGTTSPLAPLHVYNATNNTIARLESGDATSRLQLKDNSGEAFVVATGDDLIFSNTSSITERMRIDSSGDIGIGTTSMAGKLNVQGSAGGVALQTTDATNSTFRISHPSAAVTLLSGGSSQHLALGTGFAEKMRIDSSGNVGIGTTSPLKLLDVKEESNGTVEQYLRNTVINLLSKINGTTSAQFGTETSHPLAFLTGNTERMRIDSSGNMLLGLTSTSFPKRLNVQGSSGAIIALKNNDTTSYAANTNTSIEFGLNTGNTGNQNGSCEIRAFKENGTNGNNARGLSFYTGGNGGSPTERLRIESNGFVSGTYKPVKTVKNTNQDHTTGERFVIPLPNTSRMFKIAGTFSWSGNGSGIIFADFGDWSDGHTVNIEGVALSFRNGASEDLDDLGNTRYQRMTPAAFDAYNLEIQYEIFITSQALQNGNDTGNNAGGGRPGAFGHIRFTHSQIGVALTTFTFQDINATGTDRLQSFAWDIDGSTGNLGSGEHTYVLEEYPLT